MIELLKEPMKSYIKLVSLYICPVIYRSFQTYSAMYEATSQNYQLILSLMGYQDNPRQHKGFIIYKIKYIHLLRPNES